MDLEKSILFQIAGNLEIFIITSLYILCKYEQVTDGHHVMAKGQ
jgi:hypothetical protein